MRPGLINTFAHIVSPSAEERLWRKGLLTWNAYEVAGFGIFSDDRHADIVHCLTASRRALERRSAAFFLKRLRGIHRARLVGDFLGECLCLDVETDGLGPEAKITTVSTYDGRCIRLYIRDRNLDRLGDALRKARLIITFNGAAFDIPLLRKHFRWNGAPRHLDLMPVLNALGYRGPLKLIETKRSMFRPPELARTGLDAVELWRRCQGGDHIALRELLAYNAADSAGLMNLAAWACWRSWDGFPVDKDSLVTPPIAEVYKSILNRLIFDNGILPVVVD